MPAVENVRLTLGAIVLGAFVAVALSGVVAVQAFLYFRTYRKDLTRVKLMVAAVWLLDAMHTCFVCYSAWYYVILNYGDVNVHDHIPITIALTVAVTAAVTFITHVYFSHRVYKLSRNNAWLAAPLVALAVCRLTAALVTTAEMARLKSFKKYTASFSSVFTLGLALSSAIDVFITVAMCFYLQHSRTGFSNMDHVIDLIMIYTVNNGALTTFATIVSMICWLAMPHNLIFMALHFGIAKLYANSLLGTLNTRNQLRGRSQSSADRDHPMPVLFPDSYGRRLTRFQRSTGEVVSDPGKLQINVEKTVHYDVDGDGVVSGESP
ncbi:hypothetical protein FA95DRAFT_1603760 [Auriscalpium vulgare]|uniref:Uncharacterized protein n=1 Tax=Auriscalpium vulgare TaxID=40419 RepID=A0ACB8S288_9AGAM|nr:hypothetical protein FA95DRAFT_1603760 [Auriscalpium vulgare]